MFSMFNVDLDIPNSKPQAPSTDKNPRPPSTDNSRDYFTKKALTKIIEQSKVFPRYHVANFKTQDKLDTLYWIEYMIGKFVYGQLPARIATSKEDIMNLISQNVNILCFKRNKRNHAKVDKVTKSTGKEFWLILMDEDIENTADLKSVSILTYDVSGTYYFLFDRTRLIDFLDVNHINDKKTNDLKRVQRVEDYNFDVLPAGALSHAKHRVVKMARNLINPQKQSMSRTGTFTRRHVRPEEYINDETFNYENEHRINKLKEIVKPTTEKTSAYDKALKFFTSGARKKRQAKTLLRKFGVAPTKT